MATLTITTPAADDPRILKAFGTYLCLTTNAAARDATGAEVKQAIIDWMKSIVAMQEHKALVASVVDPTPVSPA